MSRAVNGIRFSLLILVGLFILSYYIIYDPVHCSIYFDNESNINGYYKALNGAYKKSGKGITKFPDIFDIILLKKIDNKEAIKFDRLSWTINSNGNIIYKNNPNNPADYIYNPPQSGWISHKDNTIINDLNVKYCTGYLTDSPITSNNAPSNIDVMLAQPVSMILIFLMLYIAYYLYSYHIDPSVVSISYDNIVNNGEYWRSITASLAHFDLMHLGFNLMGLYQLGQIESVYGSVVFAYLSIGLIPITSILCIIIYHIMITRFNRTDQIYQSAVGYSCVLFAWIVAVSVRMDKFCPIFLFPSFCFTTWTIPYLHFPVNIGPFILLIVTKFIIPRSSFVGHLSGIIIGYPLAWNMLNWLTPPLLLSILIIFYCWNHELIAWKLIGYNRVVDIYEFVPEEQLKTYNNMKKLTYLLFIITPIAIYIYNDIIQIIPRLVLVLVTWNTIHSRCCYWLTDSTTTYNDIAYILLVNGSLLICMVIYDSMTIGATISGFEFIHASGLSTNHVIFGIIITIILLILEYILLLFIILSLHDMKLVKSLLYNLRLDEKILEEDLIKLNLSSKIRQDQSSFSGVGHRLNTMEIQQSATENIHQLRFNSLNSSNIISSSVSNSSYTIIPQNDNTKINEDKNKTNNSKYIEL